MNVGRRMSRPVITVQPDMPITKAHEIMAHAKIHRVPVVRGGKLIGIVTEQDILKAYPSSATSLAVWEVTSLIEKVTVKDIMVSNVMTVQEDTSFEETARIMADNGIGSLLGWFERGLFSSFVYFCRGWLFYAEEGDV